MGMHFNYNLSECDDYRACKLQQGTVTKADPHHWHLINLSTGGDWTYKTQEGALEQLVALVRANYARFYPVEE